MRKITTFKTELGQINLLFKSNNEFDFTKCNDGFKCKNDFFEIDVIEFTQVKDWRDKTDFKIKSSIGWIFLLRKISDSNVKLKFECVLTPNSSDITSEPDTGEHLDSIWIENQTDVVSIGTEDAEIMSYRAKDNDWMPERFENKLGYIDVNSFFSKKIKYCSFTEISPFSLKTEIPKLKKEEKFYFHYIVATDKLRKSIDHPNEYDISTNLAVGYPKRTLLKKLNLKI